MTGSPISSQVSLETYGQLIASSPDAMAVFDANLLIVMANQAQADLLGFTSPEQLMGLDARLFFPPDEMPLFLAKGQQLRQGSPVPGFECTHFRRDGSRIPVEVSLAPIRDAEGHLTFILVVMRDISQRVQLEEAYAVLARDSIQGLCIIQAERLVYINPAMEAIWGVTHAEVIASSIDDVIARRLWHAPAKDHVAPHPVEHHHEDLTGWPNESSFESTLVWPDGSTHWIENRLVKIAYHGCPAMQIISLDITARKQAEILLHQREEGDRQRLEEMVAARTTQLTRLSQDLEATNAQYRAEITTRKRVETDLRAIDACRQALIRATDEVSLYQEICRIICAEVGYRLAWVGLAEQDQARTFRPVAWSSAVGDFLVQDSITWADEELGKGLAATAARTGKTILVNNYDLSDSPLRDAYLSHGFLSAISLPLVTHFGEILGSLTIYSALPASIIPEEIRLLEKLAEDLAYGVANLRARAERDRAQQELNSSLSMFAAIFDTSPDAIMLACDPDQRIVNCNPAYLDILGYKYADVIGRTSIELGVITEAQRAEAAQFMDDWGNFHNYEMKNRRKDGSYVTILYSSRTISVGDEKFVLSFGRDITDLKWVQDINVARLNLVQFSANHSLAELLEDTLSEGEKLTGSQVGFYHYVNEDQLTLTLQTWSSRTLEGGCNVQVDDHHYPVDQAGVWADAVRQRQVVIHDDIASLPHRKGMPEGHVAVTREMVYPVIRGEKIVAILGVGNKPTSYTPRDVETITLFGDLAWDIVERKKVEDALKENILQIERFNRLALGREGRIVELKQQANALAQAAGKDLPYPAVNGLDHEIDHPPDLTSTDEVALTAGILPRLFGQDLSDAIFMLIEEFIGCAVAIADLDGHILASSNSPSLCAEFHRKNSLTLDRCKVSDAILLGQIKPDSEYAISRCLNGLVDIACPIRYHGQTMAYIMIGQFFTEPPDLDYFRAQAQEFGFDPAGYLAAVQKVPIIEKERMPAFIRFIVAQAELIISITYERELAKNTEEQIKQRASSLGKGQLAALSLAEDAELARIEIARYRDHLEELVQERTSQLTETASRLEAANLELEAFTYSVSHDLRAPLRSVDGFSQILLQDYSQHLDAEGQAYLRRIRSGAGRMSELIEDLLHLSRISRAEIHLSRVDLSSLAWEVANDLKESQSGRRVSFHIAPEMFVQADLGLARVILENLLSNSWKFTSHHPEASIEFGSSSREGQTVFYVKDDGAGFDPEYAYKLFGVFQRLHNTTEFPGTGVGLATVKRVVHRHGGRIWAEGAVELGATFYFTLPENLPS